MRRRNRQRTVPCEWLTRIETRDAESLIIKTKLTRPCIIILIRLHLCYRFFFALPKTFRPQHRQNMLKYLTSHYGICGIISRPFLGPYRNSAPQELKKKFSPESINLRRVRMTNKNFRYTKHAHPHRISQTECFCHRGQPYHGTLCRPSYHRGAWDWLIFWDTYVCLLRRLYHSHE